MAAEILEPRVGERFINTPRFRKGLDVARDIFSESIAIGQENFDLVPKGRSIVVASSHLKVFDLPFVASAVPNEFQIGLPNVSVQWRFLGDPAINTLMRIAGRRNFFKIDYPGYKHATPVLPPSRLNMKNFEVMAEEMKNGMTPVISLYTPSSEDRIPAETGVGAMLLAQLTDALIVPASVVFDTDDPRVGQAGVINFVRTAIKHPNVRISFGAPIELEKIDVKPLSSFLALRSQKGGGRKPSGTPDPEWELSRQRAREVRDALAKQGSVISQKILAMTNESRILFGKNPY